MIDKLRRKYKEFVYDSYSYSYVDGNIRASFKFISKPDITFVAEIVIKGVAKESFEKLDHDILNNLIFNLGLVEIPSYWKAICSPVIKINAGFLNEEQIEWWDNLIMSGMGQFFYENKIDFTGKDFLKIECRAKEKKSSLAVVGGNKILVPVGGGKDSAVTLEIFSENYKGTGAFVLNPTKSSLDTIEISGVKNVIEVERIIDPKLLELNQKGYLNGHTPVSSVYAFISVLCAYIFGYKDIAFSNERSSSEENVVYLGQKINHQYSKTFEFENKFREYNQKYLSNINYFSFLRPLYELQISKVFSLYPKYFSAIKSCNRGQKMGGIWCCECPKCLSTFILLYPFLGEHKILEVFPKNLYESLYLYNLLEDLILDDRVKPFECVGTREELKIGLYLSTKLFEKKERRPILLEKVWDDYLSEEKDWEGRCKNILKSWNDKNNLSLKFKELLQKYE